MKEYRMNDSEKAERQRAIEILDAYVKTLAEKKGSKKGPERYAYDFALNIVEAIRKDIAG